MRAACSGIWVSASKRAASIGGCYKDRGKNVNGKSSFINDKKILMYWQLFKGSSTLGMWMMNDAVRLNPAIAYAGGSGGGPGPKGTYDWNVGAGFQKERLVVGE